MFSAIIYQYWEGRNTRSSTDLLTFLECWAAALSTLKHSFYDILIDLVWWKYTGLNVDAVNAVLNVNAQISLIYQLTKFICHKKGHRLYFQYVSHSHTLIKLIIFFITFKTFCIFLASTIFFPKCNIPLKGSNQISTALDG